MSARTRILTYLADRGWTGTTWKEAADDLGLHHGSVSGTLSNLHKDGTIVRLRGKREDGLTVYVLPEFVEHRPTRPYKPRTPDINRIAKDLATLYDLDVDTVLRRVEAALTTTGPTIGSLLDGTETVPYGTHLLDVDGDTWTLTDTGWALGDIRDPREHRLGRPIGYVHRHYGPLRIKAPTPTGPPPCPECAVGKHGNCDGQTWDDTTDAPALCPCTEPGHGITPPRCTQCGDRHLDGEH